MLNVPAMSGEDHLRFGKMLKLKVVRTRDDLFRIKKNMIQVRLGIRQRQSGIVRGREGRKMG